MDRLCNGFYLDNLITDADAPIFTSFDVLGFSTGAVKGLVMLGC